MSEELKPCFCSYCGYELKVYLDENSDYSSNWHYAVTHKDWPNLPKGWECPADGGSYATEAEAIAAMWNRPIEDALRREVEELKDKLTILNDYGPRVRANVVRLEKEVEELKAQLFAARQSTLKEGLEVEELKNKISDLEEEIYNRNLMEMKP